MQCDPVIIVIVAPNARARFFRSLSGPSSFRFLGIVIRSFLSSDEWEKNVTNKHVESKIYTYRVRIKSTLSKNMFFIFIIKQGAKYVQGILFLRELYVYFLLFFASTVCF